MNTCAAIVAIRFTGLFNKGSRHDPHDNLRRTWLRLSSVALQHAADYVGNSAAARLEDSAEALKEPRMVPWYWLLVVGYLALFGGLQGGVWLERFHIQQYGLDN